MKKDYPVYLFRLDFFFNSSSMNVILDDFKTLIQSSVYADGNKMYSNSDFDNNIENNIGGGGQTVYGLKSFVQEKSDYITSQIDCTLAVNDFVEVNFSIYPNPAQDRLEIKSNYQLKTITIYNILERSSNENEVTIDVNQLSNGIYLINIETEAGIITTKKVIIEK